MSNALLGVKVPSPILDTVKVDKDSWLAFKVVSVIVETNMKPDTILEFPIEESTAALDDTVDPTNEDAETVLIVIEDAVIVWNATELMIEVDPRTVDNTVEREMIEDAPIEEI